MAYKIPLFNLNFDEREAQAAYDTIKSGWISTGPKNAELEAIFQREYFTKAQVVESIKKFIPNFEHEEKGKNLDQKM